jgi:predicted ATP-grasp superfamily ATP-dependent carboligase
VARFSRAVSIFASWSSQLKNNGLPEYLVKSAEKYELGGWVLFPSHDEQVRSVAQHRSLLAERYVLTTPSWETVRVFYDKRLTYELAREVGVAIPRSDVPGGLDRLVEMDVEFPVLLKPSITPHFLAVTNRKAYRADNWEELQCLYESIARVIGPSEVIVQECLPEPSKNLYSFAGFFRQGEPIVGLSAKRTRQFPRDFGRTSTFVETVEIPELKELAAYLLRAVHYTGLAEIEFMWNVKRARFELLDVNTRLWAWHSLAIASGLDLPYVAFADALGQNPSVGTVRQGTKWVRFFTDVRAAAQPICSGKLGLREYITSLRGTIAFSIFSLRDPLPFIIEPFLLAIHGLAKLVSGGLPFRSRRPAQRERNNT